MDQTKPANSSGGVSEVHTCRQCGWPFPGPNPSSKDRRAHKIICGTVEGFTDTKLIGDDEQVSDSDDFDSGDEVKDKTPSPKTEKKIIKESGSSALNRSEDDMFSAATEFSDTGFSPGVTSSEVRKLDEFFESYSKDPDKLQENDTKDSLPLVQDKVIDQMEVVFDIVHTLPVVKDEIVIEDYFEVKPVQESVHESQTSESAFEENIVTQILSDAEASCDKQPVMSVGELIEAEVDHSVPVLTESLVSGVKVGSSETMVLTGQQSGVGVSFCSSRNSLGGVWGSVSDISDVIGKSERQLDRSHAFKGGPSLVESEEETIEQKASEEVNAVKVKKSQPSKSEDSITKVTNWSTSGHIATAPLRKLMNGANSPISKPLSSLVIKDEEIVESGQPGKSNLTQETPQVNQESSPVMKSGEGKLVKKKTKLSSLMKYVCCSAPVTK